MSRWIRKISLASRLPWQFLRGLKLPEHARNLLGVPRLYDVFVTAKGNAVCVIAPYYSRGAFERSVCEFARADGTAASARCAVVREPEQSCLIALFPIPAGMLRDASFRASIVRGGRTLWTGELPNALLEPRRYRLSAGLHIYEHHYVAEWIEHHLSVGVEHFYVYDTGREEDRPRMLAVLAPYAAKGLVTYVPWSPVYRVYYYGLKPFWPVDSHMYNQIPQIEHMIYKYAGETEWMLGCDVDEYFYSPNCGDLKKVLAAHPDAAALRAKGFYFGGTPDDAAKVARDGVVATFVRSEREPTSPTKMILRTAAVPAASIHEILEAPLATMVPPEELVFNHYWALGWKKRLNGGFGLAVGNRRISEARGG